MPDSNVPDSIEQPIRLALLGAGTFARDAHLPSLLKHPQRFQIAALYSRTHATAQSLAAQIPYAVDIYTDLDALLARPDIEAVEVLLPINAMPDAIRKTLAAGKHLLSEKPIAGELSTARQLLAHAHASSRCEVAQDAHHSGPIWMVGENWRYEEAFIQAAELVRSGQIGAPLTCHWAIYTPMTAKNKYYHTLWRRDSSVPGGFILDGGVHHLAALRLILGEITSVSATWRLNLPELPPADTIAATLSFAGGTLGVYLATYATSAPWSPQLYIGGSRGTIRVQRKQIELTREGETEQIETSGFDGVEKELLAFATSIRSGAPHRNSPQEAFNDLAVVEALLTSAATGQPVTPEKL